MNQLPIWLIVVFSALGLGTAGCAVVIVRALLKQNAAIKHLEKLASDSPTASSR